MFIDLRERGRGRERETEADRKREREMCKRNIDQFLPGCALSRG